MIAEDRNSRPSFPNAIPTSPRSSSMSKGSKVRSIFCLTLARQQKVDLAKISILALADQYLAFIEEARKLRLELAADYLVMAAWLAYLKSRLLLPPEQHEPDGISAEDMATALAQRLRRLEAIRHVAEQLLNRPQLGREVFARGLPRADRRDQEAGMVGDAVRSSLRLCAASARSRRVLSCACRNARCGRLSEAREAVERLIGIATDWCALDEYLIAYMAEPSHAATVRASSFAATLELVREGLLEMNQQKAFAPLYVRKRQGDGVSSVSNGVVEVWEWMTGRPG